MENARRSEFEYAIPTGDAEEMMALCVGPPIQKRRHRLPHAGHVWEVDIFSGANAPLMLAEVELASVDEHGGSTRLGGHRGHGRPSLPERVPCRASRSTPGVGDRGRRSRSCVFNTGARPQGCTRSLTCFAEQPRKALHPGHIARRNRYRRRRTRLGCSTTIRNCSSRCLDAMASPAICQPVFCV